MRNSPKFNEKEVHEVKKGLGVLLQEKERVRIVKKYKSSNTRGKKWTVVDVEKADGQIVENLKASIYLKKRAI